MTVYMVISLLKISYVHRTYLLMYGSGQPCTYPLLQVDLQYPMERDKAARLAADATHLGFNKIPEEAAAVLRSAPSSTPTPTPTQTSNPTSSSDPSLKAQPSRDEGTRGGGEGEGGAGNVIQAGREQGPSQAADAAISTTHCVVSDGQEAARESPASAPAAPGAKTAPSTAVPAAPAAPAAAECPHKPLFSELLHRSLLAVSETRAWFNETRGYAMVRQSRLPTALPQVCVDVWVWVFVCWYRCRRLFCCVVCVYMCVCLCVVCVCVCV